MKAFKSELAKRILADAESAEIIRKIINKEAPNVIKFEGRDYRLKYVPITTM